MQSVQPSEPCAFIFATETQASASASSSVQPVAAELERLARHLHLDERPLPEVDHPHARVPRHHLGVAELLVERGRGVVGGRVADHDLGVRHLAECADHRLHDGRLGQLGLAPVRQPDAVDADVRLDHDLPLAREPLAESADPRDRLSVRAVISGSGVLAGRRNPFGLSILVTSPAAAGPPLQDTIRQVARQPAGSCLERHSAGRSDHWTISSR